MTGLEPVASKDWNRAKARHLLNRAGFGVPHDAIDKLARLSTERAVDLLVDFEQFEDVRREPDFLPPVRDFRALRQSMRDLNEDERRRRAAELRREERQAVNELKAWWLRLMLETKRPLQEKMTLFWHGHFATSALKVQSAGFNYDLNSRFRRLALDNFRWLTIAVAKSPAMLRYLDNQQNIKRKPNENFARELLELFTMGIGRYTEDDVKEAARAFTGWTHRNGEFVFNARQHDDGIKTFLGRRGRFSGEDIIDIVCERPETAEYMTRKLWEYFVYENPDDDLVAQFARVFRDSGLKVSTLLRRIFLSREFYSDRAMGSQIKSPAQYMVMLIDGLALELQNWRVVTFAMRQMGQDLFMPPNVKGWPGNREWINTNTLLVRYNVPAYAIWGLNLNSRPIRELDDGETGMNAMNMMNAGENDIQNRASNLRNHRHVPRGPFNAVAFFDEFNNLTCGEAVNRLAEYFLGRSLDADQRRTLVDILNPDGAADSIFHPREISEERLCSAVHLTLSMAEYQLC